jgi:hypothetical protein
MAQQAAQVRDLTIRRIDVHQQRWRSFQVPLEKFNLANLNKTLKDLDTLDAEIASSRRKAAQPHPHAFQIVAEQ